MKCIGCSRHFFIWAHPVNTFHKDIAKYDAIQTTQRQERRDLKSRIAFQSA